MKAIGAALFDLDGTLLDRRASFRAFAAAFIAERFPDGKFPEGFEDMIARMEELDGNGYGRKTMLYETLIRRWNLKGETVQGLIDAHHAAFARFVRPDPDMEHVLDALASRYRLGLITNGTSHGQHLKIDKLGIRHRFEVIVVSGDVGIHKPDPRIFELCLSKMRLDPTQAVYVGDHYENDVRGAQAVGLSAIWYAGAAQKADVPVAAWLRDILKFI